MNLYYDDWHKTELDTEVVRCEKAEGGWKILTKETIFYPESGGEAADQGTVGGIPFTRLMQQGEDVWVYLPEKAEGKVHLSVDRQLRETHCEIHSSQHLVCGIINKRYQAATIAFFNDEWEEGAEMGFSSLDESVLRELEDLSNACIRQDIPVRILYPTREEAERHVPDEKLEHDQLRAVLIGDIDYNMCGCIHVPSLRHLGMVKFTHFEKTTRGYRIYWVCGHQLSRMFESHNRALHALGRKLSVPVQEVESGVEKLEEEIRDCEREIKAYKEKEYRRDVEALCRKEGETVIELLDHYDPKEFARLGSTAARESGRNIFLVDDLGSRVRIGLWKGKGDADLQRIFSSLQERFEIKGGGNPASIQGSASGSAQEIVKALREICRA